MLGEQRDAPLVVVEPGRPGDDLQHAPGEVAARGAVLEHELLAIVVGQLVPVLVRLAALGHRVEAPGRLALGRQLRVQPGLAQRRRARPGRTRSARSATRRSRPRRARRPGRSAWSGRRRHRSSPRAMKATSALWPSIATATTWSPAASARLTAAVTSSASVSGPSLQNRCRTPQPTFGDTASLTAASVGPPSRRPARVARAGGERQGSGQLTAPPVISNSRAFGSRK